MAIVTQSTRCEVLIVTPESTHVTFSTDAPQHDLLHVETQKDINQACGSFTLTFAPTVDERGRTWDERIPMRSLVTIKMERPDEPDMPNVDSTVMVGITDTHAHTEDWRQAQPQRRSTISGREIACIMVDAELWFHQALEGQPGVINAQVAAAGLERIRLQWQPDLAGSGDDPRDTLEAILRYFLLGGFTPSATRKVSPAPKTEGKGQEAVINLQFPERSLDTLLVLNKSAWSLFETGVTVAIANNSAFVGSIWNYLHIFIDESFQEFFTRVEKGASYIYFRGKPFKKVPVTEGTRFANDPTVQSLFLEPRWVLAASLAYQSSSTYNVFWCQPMGMQRYLEKTGFKYLIPPEIITEARHPSFVGRYGLRVMEVGSPYLPALQPPTPAPGSSQTGVAPKAAAPVKPTVTAAPASFLPLPNVDLSQVPSTARIPGERLRDPTSQYYATLAATTAKAQGVPESMVPSFLALVDQESSWNPNATGTSNDIGLGQFTPGTARDYGLITADGVDYRKDPVRSLTASAQYYRDLIKQFGPNPDKVNAAYNAGAGAVARGAIPESTKVHVAEVNKRIPFFTANKTPSAQPSASPPTPPAPAPRAAPGAPSAAPAPEAGVPIQPVVDVARRWSRYLRAWYDSGPILAVGSFTVRGHPSWNVGHRLVMIDDRGEREFYIEGVGHRYDLRSGHYVTSMRVTRGWYTDERPARVPPAGVRDDLTAGTIEQTPLSAGEIVQTPLTGGD